MYEDRTQHYDPEIQEESLIHDTPFFCHIIYSQLRQQTSAVNVSLNLDF